MILLILWKSLTTNQQQWNKRQLIGENVMIKEMGKELIEWFKRKDRSYVSTLAYILCGVLSFLAVASLISPFAINVSFIDDIVWKTDLTNNSTLVNAVLVLAIISALSTIVRYCVIRKTDSLNNAKYASITATFHTIEDIFDLFASFFSLLFMIAVFLQIYHRHIPFLSSKAYMIYLFIAYRLFDYLWHLFESRNSAIIKKALEKYKELD